MTIKYRRLTALRSTIDAVVGNPAPEVPGLAVTVSTIGGRCEITVAGDLDIATADGLADTGREIIASSDAAVVVVDLAGVEFAGSSGLGALISLHQVAEGVGKAFYLRNPTSRVARVIQLMGLDVVLPIEPTSHG